MQYSFRPHLYSKGDSVWLPIYKELGINIGNKRRDKIKRKKRLVTSSILQNLWTTKADKLIMHLSQKHYDKGESQEHYNKGGLYRQFKTRRGMTYAVARDVLEKLIDAGYIDVYKGDNSKNDGKQYSNIRPRPKLKRFFRELERVNREIPSGFDPIRLKQKDPKTGEYIYVDVFEMATSQKERQYLDDVNGTMDRFHAMIQKVHFSYCPSEGLEMFYPNPPDFENRYLTADYKDDPKNGGRMYNAFWVTCPRNKRPYIQIDGEWTVDFDFDHFHVELLYSKIGCGVPKNAYIYDKEIDPEKRKTAKMLFQIMVNSKDKSHRTDRQKYADIIKAFRKKKKNSKDIFSHEDLVDIIQQLEKKHHKICHLFYSGLWGELQKTESDLMRTIMNKAMDEGVVILPIHDGLMCKVSDQDRVREIMEETGYPYSWKLMYTQWDDIETELATQFLLNIKVLLLDNRISNLMIFNLLLLSSSYLLKGYKMYTCSNTPWKYRRVEIPRQEELTINDLNKIKDNWKWVVKRNDQEPVLVMAGYAHLYHSVDDYNALIPENIRVGDEPEGLKNYYINDKADPEDADGTTRVWVKNPAVKQYAMGEKNLSFQDQILSEFYEDELSECPF